MRLIREAFNHKAKNINRSCHYAIEEDHLFLISNEVCEKSTWKCFWFGENFHCANCFSYLKWDANRPVCMFAREEKNPIRLLREK